MHELHRYIRCLTCKPLKGRTRDCNQLLELQTSCCIQPTTELFASDHFNQWQFSGQCPDLEKRTNRESEKVTSWWCHKCNGKIIAWTSYRSRFCQVFQKYFCSWPFRSWEIREDHRWLIRACRQIFQRIQLWYQPIWILPDYEFWNFSKLWIFTIFAISQNHNFRNFMKL